MEAFKNILYKNDQSNTVSIKSEINSLAGNTPLLDINQSTTPLNHYEDDKHSFNLEGICGRISQNASIFQQNQQSETTSSVSYGDLNHIKGAEQRKKLFTQFRNSDISDQNKQEEEQQEIHSPSLTSNSFIFKAHEEFEGKPEVKNIKSPHNLKTSLRMKSNQFNEKTDEQQQQQLGIKGNNSNSKVSSLSQIENKQSTTIRRLQNTNGSNQNENIVQSNSWIGSTIPNISQKIMQGIQNDIGRDYNMQSAANSFSDMSVNHMQNNVLKGQLNDDSNIYPAKSSLSNAFNDSQNRVQFEHDISIIKNNNINSLQQSESALVTNFPQNGRNPNSLNFNITDIKTLDVIAQQKEMRRGSNFLEIPSPTNQGGTQNPTSYQRKNSDKSQLSQRTQNKQKKRNFLKAFYFTYKFLQKMKFVKKYKNIYMLEKKHFKLIKDNAFGGLYERLGQRNSLTKFISNITYFLFDLKSPFHAFQPTSFPLLIFEFSILLILLFLSFYIPLKVCFASVPGFYEPESITKFINAVPYILLLEIFINLNTAYFSQGSTVNDRKSIIIRYLSFKFWIDVLTIICLNQSSIVPLIFILRIYQVFKILYDFDESFQIQFKFPTTFELTKLCLIILFVAHICACGFHLILDYQSSTTESWVSKSNVNHKSWQEIYIAALYFSFTTMITVGFGDIVPYSLLERVYVIIMQLISCGVFAYAINTIGSIFQDIARKSAEYRQQKQEIIDYMMRRRISKQTQIKVLKYLEYIHSSSEAGHKKGYEILNLLSKRLKDVVYKEYYGRILMQFKLFNRKFSEKFIKTLSLYMREQTLGPGEVLYNEGELDQRLFYIQSGEIEQFADLQENGHKDILLQTLKQGDYFGQYGFLGNQKSKNSARSLNVSQVVYCTLEDFTYVIRQFPNDFETYCSLKDSINLSDEKLDVICSGCNRFNHQVQNCPLLHYEIDKEAHIRRYIHSDPQKRDENFSRNKPYFHKWASKYQSILSNREQTANQIKKRDKNYQYQRFNVKKEYYDLRVALRILRLKLSDPEEKNLSEEQLQKIYEETDDRKFILETKVPTLYIHKQKKFLKNGRQVNDEDEDGFDDEDEDLYEEEFADYEDIMNNDHSQITNNVYNNITQQSYQRMSTLSSQIHVPTEKSLYLKMPSEHNFKASGNNSKVMEESSEDYEDEEDDEDKKRISRNSSNRYIDRANLGHQVSFKEDKVGNPPRKSSNHTHNYQKGINNNNNIDFNQMMEDENGYQQKSLFYRGVDQGNIVQPSPTRYMNRHKTLNPSSFNNLTLNFETYLKSSQLDNNPSSMGSIVLNQQGSKRKGTVLSSVGQGSSKLRQQGSQDFSINIQRTGTLNSNRILKNSNPALSSKKLSDKNALSRSNTGKMSKIDSKRDPSKQINPSSTQFAKFANTIKDNYSEKINKNQNGSEYSKQDTNIMSVISDFDKGCEFAHYLPWNNLSNVIKSYKRVYKNKSEFLGVGKSVKTFKTYRTTKNLNTIVNAINNTSKKGLNDTILNASQAPGSFVNNNNNNNNNVGTPPTVNLGMILNQASQGILLNNNYSQQNYIPSDKAVITVNIPESYSPSSSNCKNEKKSPPIIFRID